MKRSVSSSISTSRMTKSRDNMSHAWWRARALRSHGKGSTSTRQGGDSNTCWSSSVAINSDVSLWVLKSAKSLQAVPLQMERIRMLGGISSSNMENVTRATSSNSAGSTTTSTAMVVLSMDGMKSSFKGLWTLWPMMAPWRLSSPGTTSLLMPLSPMSLRSLRKLFLTFVAMLSGFLENPVLGRPSWV